MSDQKNEWVDLLANYGHVGGTFVFSIVIGLLAGIELDKKVFGNPPDKHWFTFIGLALGIAAGFWTLIKVAMRANREDKKKDQNGR
jgi:F0F1-type ATP synthase assembly protein I